MNNEKNKIIKDYVLIVLLILSLLMIIIPVIITVFNTNILTGIYALGCLIGIPISIVYLIDND